jgi:hypothetical protein
MQIRPPARRLTANPGRADGRAGISPTATPPAHHGPVSGRPTPAASEQHTQSRSVAAGWKSGKTTRAGKGHGKGSTDHLPRSLLNQVVCPAGVQASLDCTSAGSLAELIGRRSAAW